MSNCVKERQNMPFIDKTSFFCKTKNLSVLCRQLAYLCFCICKLSSLICNKIRYLFYCLTVRNL